MAPLDRGPNRCSVCGKPFGPRFAQMSYRCKCPWHKPFEAWPEGLRKMVSNIAAGEARER